MKRGDTKVFENRQNLYCALNLRRVGWSFSSIAFLYGCDRTTVENQCQKYAIEPQSESIYSIESIAARAMPPPPSNRWIVIDGERINRGRSYRDYFEGKPEPTAWVTVSIAP